MGGWDTTLKVLIIMAAIDYIKGVFAAGFNRESKSKVGFKGIDNELLLLLENAGRMGVPLPSTLTNAVGIFGGKQKQEDNKGDIQ